MNKFITIIGAAAVMCLGGTAQAQNWYISGFGGINYSHDADSNAGDVEYDLGYGLGGTVGYDMQGGFRIEGEVAYRQNDFDRIGAGPSGAELKIWTFMANALYDFNLESSLRPHIGAGLGAVNGAADFGGVEFDDTAIGLQLIAGIDYNVAPDLALVLDYKYLTSTDLELGGAGVGDLEYSSSLISVGLRKSF